MPIRFRLLFATTLMLQRLVAAPVTLDAYIVQSMDETCGTSNGYIDAGVSGGSPPYSYSWSNGAITEDLYNIPAGTYTLVVTDAMSAQDQVTVTINNNNALVIPYFAQDGHANCPGQCWGEVQLIEPYIGGTPPFQYYPAPAGYDAQSDPYFIFPGTCGGTDVFIQVTDANGCTGTAVETVMEPQVGAGPMVIQSVVPSCNGGANGAVTVGNIYNGYSWFQPPVLLLFDAQGNIINSYGNGGFTGLLPGHYAVGRDWNNGYQYTAYPCNYLDTVGFDVPDLGPTCGTVSGEVYIDADQDCVHDGFEAGVPYEVLLIQPGAVYAITDAGGSFTTNVANGSYTLAQTDPALIQHCPAQVPTPFTVNNNTVSLSLADSSTAPLDMRVSLTGGPFRPGFDANVWLNARNASPQLSGPVTVTCTLDLLLVYVGAVPPPNTIAGNVLTWNFPAFAPYQSNNIHVVVNVPVTAPLGAPVVNIAAVDNTLPDGVPANNTSTHATAVQGSYDPNDKNVRTSSGWSDDTYIIGTDEWLDYTIRFQNTGTDTAFTVVVTDTLDADLDMAFFEQGVASHAFTVQFLPERVVRWTFANILLPDSGTNEVASHGAVSFRIRPMQPVLPGTEYRNNADIFFDFNAPVRTNDAVVTAEVSTAVQEHGQERLRVWPNPAQDAINVSVGDAELQSVELLSMDGRVARRVVASGRSVHMDLNGLASGGYVVKARISDGTIHFVRLINL